MYIGRSREEWIAQYAHCHQEPRNCFCHTIGITMIVVAIAVDLILSFVTVLRLRASILFVLGWVLRYIDHVYEGKALEFFMDWRFLFAGLR